jgi:hypothetical protein
MNETEMVTRASGNRWDDSDVTAYVNALRQDLELGQHDPIDLLLALAHRGVRYPLPYLYRTNNNEHRLLELEGAAHRAQADAPTPPTTPTNTTWCGACDRRTRMVETGPDRIPARCPTCHGVGGQNFTDQRTPR